MSRITTSQGLTYENDKTQCFSYTNDIVNNLLTLDTNIINIANKTKNMISILNYENLKVSNGGDIYDWSPCFQRAFSEYTYVCVPDGDFYVNSTINIPESKGLIMTPLTRIIALSDINIVRITRSSELNGGTLYLKDGATKACIYLYGLDKNADYTVSNIVLEGVNYSGIGIHFDSSMGDEATSFSMMGSFHNVKVKTINIGIFCDSGTGTGWVNANMFDNIQIWGAKTYIKIGEACDGNTFTNLQFQWAVVTEKFLEIDGSYNKFKNVTYWDIPDNLPLAILGENSELNRIEYIDFNADDGREVSQVVIDKGSENIIVDPYIQEQKGLCTNPITYVNNDGTLRYGLNRFLGDQDDILFNAARKYTISKSEGISSVESMFKSIELNDPYFAEYTFIDTEEVYVEIDFGVSTSLTGFGISFYDLDIASDFKIIATHNLIDYELYKVTNNRSASIYIPLYQDISLEKLKLVLQKPLTISGIKTDKIVRIQRFYAKSKALGGTFVSTIGGTIDGQLKFLYSGNEDQGVVLNSPNGTKYLLQVSDSGVLSTKIL